MTALDNRPSCTFRRDVSECIGQVFGPTLAGELLVMAEVRPDGDRWRAFYRYATAADVQPGGEP